MKDAKMHHPLPRPPDDVREAALSTLTSWVAAIADRVNNPVAATLAGLSLVQRAIEAQSQGVPMNAALVSESLERIKGRLTALAEYVQELQNFGKPDNLAPCDVKLQTAIATILVDRDARGEFAGELDLDLKAPVAYADYPRLKVALGALMVNGWEAAAREPVPRVKVSSVPAAEGVEILVEDNGPGFSSAAVTRAGEPFFSTKEAGTGLGIAIVQKFVAAHGGTMSLGKSPSLGGAMVKIFLPSRR